MSDNKTRTIQLGDNDWRNMIITEMKRTGGDPSFFFEILEDIIKEKAWENLLDDKGNPVGSLYRLIEAPPPIGCGQKVEKVLRLLEIEHRYESDNKTWHERMKILRENVHKELSHRPLELKNKKQHTLLLTQLEREAPDIAKKISQKKMDVKDGLTEVRKRRTEQELKRRAVNLYSAESALETLTKYMPLDVLDELIDLLVEWRND